MNLRALKEQLASFGPEHDLKEVVASGAVGAGHGKLVEDVKAASSGASTIVLLISGGQFPRDSA